MKNPIKSINETARRTGKRILQKVHDKSEYILTTDKATRKANRQSARADKKAASAAQQSRTRRFMKWAGSARPLWFLNREQAKA